MADEEAFISNEVFPPMPIDRDSKRCVRCLLSVHRCECDWGEDDTKDRRLVPPLSLLYACRYLEQYAQMLDASAPPGVSFDKKIRIIRKTIEQLEEAQWQPAEKEAAND